MSRRGQADGRPPQQLSPRILDRSIPESPRDLQTPRLQQPVPVIATESFVRSSKVSRLVSCLQGI